MGREDAISGEDAGEHCANDSWQALVGAGEEETGEAGKGVGQFIRRAIDGAIDVSCEVMEGAWGVEVFRDGIGGQGGIAVREYLLKLREHTSFMCLVFFGGFLGLEPGVAWG